MANVRPLYEVLASTLVAIRNCVNSGNQEWKLRHESRLRGLCKAFLPSGAGLDSGSLLVRDACAPEKLVFETSFHHMNEHGVYDGWTNHKVTVTPSFSGGIHIKIFGKNRNQVREYIYQVFDEALRHEISREAEASYGGVPEDDEDEVALGAVDDATFDNAFDGGDR